VIVVELGNARATSMGAGKRRVLLDGERTTTVRVPEDWSLDMAVAAVVASWEEHSQPGFAPAWVQCSDPGLAEELASRFALRSDQLAKPADWGSSVGKRYDAAAHTEAEALIVEAEAAQVAADTVGRPL
jgi:hypothetical protein